jgi:hypothetical protein
MEPESLGWEAGDLTVAQPNLLIVIAVKKRILQLTVFMQWKIRK